MSSEPKVRHFDSTEEAYAATQCDETIRDGDVLVIQPEQVIGIAWTWPFALTERIGELHVTTADPRTREDGIFVAGVELAERLAWERGWRIVPPLDVALARELFSQHPRCGQPLGFKVLTRKTEAGRERTGWLLAGTAGFIELDTYGHIVCANKWAPLTNEQEG